MSASQSYRAAGAFAASPCSHCAPRLRELREPGVQASSRALSARHEPRQAEVAAHVGVQEADRREQSRAAAARAPCGCPCCARRRRACSGPAPPNATQREIARVLALLDRDHAHRAHHVDVDDLDHAGRGARRGPRRALAASVVHRRLRACPACIAMRPPSSAFGFRRPSTTFASVTVGSRAAAPVGRRVPDRRPRSADRP